MTTSSIQTLKSGSVAGNENTVVDLFSAKGFALAQRIAQALSSSDAVPAQFRSHQLKKAGGQEAWVENTSAMGNCIVAIEVAQSIGMSITAVMQNADVIEGKLRWSDKFIVAGINASRRFTPLRFDVKNLGMVTATYKEKGAWDKQANRFTFIDRTVTVENLQSIAWAFPAGFNPPANIYTLDQAKSAGLPVIEGAPVSMQLAVEEGWYGKPGSKWQTSLKHKMLMMRSGRYFGDIHAPDITMGFGRTTEEEADIIDVTPQQGGVYGVNLEDMKKTTAPAPEAGAGSINTETGEVTQQEQPREQPQTGAPLTDAEIAAIRAREIADAEGEQAPAQRTARPRGGMGVE